VKVFLPFNFLNMTCMLLTNLDPRRKGALHSPYERAPFIRPFISGGSFQILGRPLTEALSHWAGLTLRTSPFSPRTRRENLSANILPQGRAPPAIEKPSSSRGGNYFEVPGRFLKVRNERGLKKKNPPTHPPPPNIGQEL